MACVFDLSMMKLANEYIAVACSWAPALQEEPTWRRHWTWSLINKTQWQRTYKALVRGLVADSLWINLSNHFLWI